MSDIGVIIGLFSAGILLLLAEVMLPGGVVGIVGLIMIASGIVAGFMYDPMVGTMLLVGAAIFGLLAFWAWARFFPGSRMGKHMFLQEDAKGWDGFIAQNAQLLGKRGVTHTMLRPSGIATIDGERIDVVSEGGIVEKGVAVEVVRVEGNRIVVARLDDLATG